MKKKIEYRAAKRNKTRGLKKIDSAYVPFTSEHLPWTVEFAFDLAKYMLNYCSDLTHIKKITGLTIKDMLQLGLVK